MKNALTLKEKAIKGVFWIGLERFFQQGIQFVVAILLARILEPAEFGLVAMIGIFMAFSGALINGGFASALIQKTNTTLIDESTVFWFNLVISTVLTGCLWLAAPWIADFYDQPSLVPITRWSSLNLVITGFCVVQLTLLQKEFLFGLRMVATMVSVSISGLVSIWMAFNGFGVWSLVVQGLVMNGSMAIMLWILHSWRPLFGFSIDSFKELFGFGSRLLVCSLMTAVFENIYRLIIGKVYSATELGFFQRAKGFVKLGTIVPVTLITQVHFPYLCKVKDDPDAMKSAFLKTLKYSAMLLFPLLVGLAVSAPNMIAILIGEKWLHSVKYIRILSATGIFFVVYWVSLDVFKACGKSSLILKMEFYKRLALGVSILLLYRYGIVSMLYGELFCTLSITVVAAVLMYRFIRVGFWAQLMGLMPFIFGALGMGLVVYFVGNLGLSLYKVFILQVLSGGLSYAFFLWMMRNSEFHELRGAIISRIELIRCLKRRR